ncbi:MAG TPA: hypothetical protein VFI91_10455, partial [Longimicrobiaceae bacterium]|nr:hypothetical protein [Longimicrobiaceae bacterium]
MHRNLLPILVLLVVLSGCRGTLQLTPSDAETVLSRQLLDAPHPAQPGPYEVRALYYGSGDDRHRPEYRDSVTIVTPTVDASELVDLGDDADEREDYWGFDSDEYPLNGRVWYPAGDGPFPVVLIAHGNHDMKDFSDPGYEYLGRLLASRGYILASLDMNFVNGGIRGENDARGWLFLKHLEQWREWNRTEGNPFEGKLDLENVALIGHSRGGEAVGHAAAFNTLSHYPDNALLDFDFGFGIQSIIAIAPVDQQYMPTDRGVPVENVDYLVMHGSHDGDVTSFHGLRQYDRVSFTDSQPHLKAAVYVYRANHGQWNTTWGAHDNGPRSGRILDLRALMPGEEQREVAEIYISAFLDVTLMNNDRYLPIFRDHRVIGHWLPKTMYITRFQTNSFRPLVNFEEDIDVTTGTAPGVVMDGDSLATWSEGELQLRSSNEQFGSATQDNQAVWIGWNNQIAGTDTTGVPAAFTLTLPESLPTRWGIDENGSLSFLLAPTKDVPDPREPPTDSSANEDTNAGESQDEREDDDDADDLPPIDLSIQVTDAAGVTASLPLHR